MSNVVELRQYTLKPGKRDVLIELFEREFVESQETAGMDVIGTFRDADNPDRFVWLRGFADMESRAQSLSAFYGGPTWKANRDAANATMIDSDNVLLLRHAWKDSGFAKEGSRAPRGSTTLPEGLVLATICNFAAPMTDALVAVCRSAVPSRCAAAGAEFLAAFVTEESPNTFPALPVREGEHVFVWFTLFANAGSERAITLPAELQHALSKPPEALRLLPTARSRLHG
ncbi:MAG: NIPSNAP family protein [Alphaproteobacteria bacterium]|nr:NIPSNAP family protein [Alphaproteobacteria bacterium]